MSDRSPSRADFIREYVAAQLAEMHVCLPAKVESFDADKQTIDAQPQVKRRLRAEDGTITHERLPVIRNVPVVYLRGGGFFSYAPLEVGDNVILHFSDYSLDQWWENGRESSPDFSHSHELTDCFAVPGGYAKPEALSSMGTKQRIGKADLHISNDGTVIKIGDGASEFIALAQKVLTELQKITTYLTAIDTVWQASIPEAGMGAPSSLGIALKAASLAVSGVPSMQSVAATKAKAE
jgi:hypothetical protein